LSQLPLAHVGGLGVVTRGLLGAVPVTWDPDDPAATLTSAVVTQLERQDHARFRVVLLGGSADWRADRAANVVRTYGLTETFGGVVYDRRALPGVEVRIGGGGEVLLRSPTLLRSYRDGTDPKDPDGWLPTGDEGELGDDGLLAVHGRRGDVIVTGGEKVWPDPVEAVLRAVPGVADVAVIGRPDPEWGEAVTAVVVPVDPSSPPTLDALRAAVKAQLPAWCAPKAIELRDDLPKTALGKVRRRAL
jgi:O-succinylbenzoic acid--CoA ligase